ncbi:MAG: DedA family protein [Gemmatimonadota bacterium]|nr:DedA family protein [Gemmatimonadota bacterium]
MNEFLQWMLGIPRGVTYALLATGAALENVVPAIPADTFVALGGLLTVVGTLDARVIFVSTWIANVGSALFMYRMGHKHGRGFFETGWGSRLLAPHQMERMEVFYARWGVLAIFFTRFLPGLRAIVPVFAGVTHHGFLPVAIPLSVASALWYGGLVWLGAFAGRNLSLLAALLDRLNSVLGLAALVIGAGVALWWWKSRHPPHE